MFERLANIISIILIFFGSFDIIFRFSSLADQAPQESELQEARLILTQRNNENKPLGKLREQLEHDLAQMFGGFTRSDGYGGWEDEDTGIIQEEPDWFYDIALSNTPENRQKLHEIATWLKDAAEQESVYLRYPDGEVVFV